jgi:VWFA-related protein
VSAQQAPTYRTTGDVIEVDVQVVSNNGQPVLGLGAEKFEVQLSGRRREVVSAQLIHHDSARSAGRATATTTTAAAGPDSAAASRPRIFILAVDSLSFDVATTVGMMEAAKQFVERLQPVDYVGLFAYPTGPEISPTTDRAVVLAGLQKVLGSRPPSPLNRFGLLPSEIVDGGGSALIRLCRGNANNIDPNCAPEVESEIRVQAQFFEEMAKQSLNRLRDTIARLARIDRRKTLVLLSAGMPVADRPGQPPDVGDLGSLVGQEAARANTAVYTLFVDWRFLQQYSAASTRATWSPLRDTAINMRWLGQFSETAGGKLFTVSTGSGTFAFDRILTETSAYYLLGVAPEDADRDGKPRQLSVKVKQNGATVRARSWAVVPKKG